MIEINIEEKSLPIEVRGWISYIDFSRNGTHKVINGVKAEEVIIKVISSRSINIYKSDKTTPFNRGRRSGIVHLSGENNNIIKFPYAYLTKEEAIDAWNASVYNELDKATHDFETITKYLKNKIIKNGKA